MRMRRDEKLWRREHAALKGRNIRNVSRHPEEKSTGAATCAVDCQASSHLR